MDLVTATSGLPPTAVVESVADPEAMRLAFEWADRCPEDRGYPHLIAAFLAVVRAVEQYQKEQQP
jgi:hypothetical protein